MVTLEEVKAQVRVEHNEEDALIETYIEAAENHIRRYCGQDFEDGVPAIVKVACLMIVAGMFEVRQDSIITTGTHGFKKNSLPYDYLEQFRVNRGVV
jgi:uncharacterized phage protein (predicted DNA packaging)